MALKIRFALNQCGLALEYFKDKEWRCACLVTPENITKNGGVSLVKSKLLLQITDRYDLTAPGEYKDGNGVTVECV
jgi:hypothetical protein